MPLKRKYPGSKLKKRKVNLVFDEEKRREFLTGFHKRKMQRKKRAQEQLEKQLKEERKKLKKDAKESYKKLVVSSRPILGLEHLLEEEYADDDVTVKITEITAEDISRKCNTIGSNNCDNNESEEIQEQSDEENQSEIPGMELHKTKKRDNTSTETNESQFSSAKEVKKTLKKMATKNVQKSTVFQKKNKLESRKQKKKALRKKKENTRIKKRAQKKKKLN